MKLKVGDIVRIDGNYFTESCRGRIGVLSEECDRYLSGFFNGTEQFMYKNDLLRYKLFNMKITKLKPNKLNLKLYPELKELM